MRMSMADWLVALVATFLGVTTLILLRGNADPVVWTPFVATAVVLAVLALWHGHRVPVVLVVGDADAQAVNDLESRLAYEGMAVRRCTGPVGQVCPVLTGDACPYDHELAAAVVQGAHGGSAAPPCEHGIDAPVVYYQAETAASVVPLVRELVAS